MVSHFTILTFCVLALSVHSAIPNSVKMKQKGQPKGISAASKRKKLNPVLGSPISESLLSKESVESISREFRSAVPFPHCILRPLCDDARLKEIFEESLQNLRADLKVHSLFR